MNSTEDKDGEELKRLEEEKDLITRQLELLRLIDKKKAKISERTPTQTDFPDFPIGTPVTFSSPCEKPSLRGKTGEVVGYSPKFVRVKRGKEKILRAPHNLTPQKK